MSARQRLDELLVARGFYTSRSRARDAVLRGTVAVDGRPACKPAQNVASDSVIAIADPGQGYVSRAALKLKYGLSHFGIAAEGRHALDVGASTGGFTQVLLEQGAMSVTAVDVGHDQMRVTDDRLILIEGLNARELTRQHLKYPIDLIVCDVSFISLRLVLPPALDLAEPGANLVALIKPQFEVGREALGKGGVVRDAAAQAKACQAIQDFLTRCGWTVEAPVPSPIEGGDGNVEFLIAAAKAG